MKQLPKTMLKRPILLGLITFMINLFVSTMPVLMLHEKHVSHYLESISHAEGTNAQWLLEQQTIVYNALIYAFILTVVISGLVTLLAYFLNKTYMEVENLSHFDGLTGLYNRLMFVTIVQKEIQKIKRHHQYLFLVILDIDDFKPINDTFGHLVGDEAIKTTAQTLKQLLRSSDTIGRFGGDEFVLCIVDDDSNAASIIINRILEEFNQKSLPVTRNNEKQSLHINLSIGYTAYKNADEFETMLHRADQALYISKEAGKNTATFLA
jgi:diguanylate cyclase